MAAIAVWRGWRRPVAQGWIVAASVAVFAAHAACYLYFFVDDEAIPLVYARNVLHGRGLVYTPLEGRVEGYSDFLHVLWSAAILAFTQSLRLDPLQVLMIETAVNFALGIGVLLLLARLLDDMSAANPARAGALGFLAFAGPLAVWSCSSLETVPFTFALTGLAVVTLPGAAARWRYLPAVLAAVVILERIDGFIYVAAILIGAITFAAPGRRRQLIREAVVPALIVAVGYHAARGAYFGSLLSAPLQAKVLYKLLPPGHLIEKMPRETYLHTLYDLEAVTLVPVAGMAIAGAWRSTLARAALLAVALIAAYVSVVGDWMFGWRFVLPTLPLLAVAAAAGIARVPRRGQWIVTAILIAASASSARGFARAFITAEGRPIWWTAPHRGNAVWLAPLGELLETARRTVVRGDVIAYNQAGLLPFVLDVDNIDDLGICSKFEAALPTTDVYFTEVGRYSPLTDAPVFGAAHAYLLYRNVRVLISRTDLLVKANDGRVPAELLAGLFRLKEIDKSGENALYVRTDRDASVFRRDPSSFWQNLAHTSRVRRLDINGAHVPDAQIGPSLPFLRWDTGAIDLTGDTRIDVRFADHDEDVFAVYAKALSARVPVALTINLYDERGRLTASEDAQPDAVPAPLLRRYDEPVRARLLSIELRPTSAATRVRLTDLRIMGQSAALRDYVRRRLRFPAP